MLSELEALIPEFVQESGKEPTVVINLASILSALLEAAIEDGKRCAVNDQPIPDNTYFRNFALARWGHTGESTEMIIEKYFFRGYISERWPIKVNVVQIARQLPSTAAIVLRHNSEFIEFDRSNSFDISMYGSRIVYVTHVSGRSGTYCLDI